jgi:hypothetical protein
MPQMTHEKSRAPRGLKYHDTRVVVWVVVVVAVVAAAAAMAVAVILGRIVMVTCLSQTSCAFVDADSVGS